MDNLWHLGDEFRGQSKVVEDRQWSLMTSKLAEITKSKAERMNDFEYARMNTAPDVKQWDKLSYHQEDNKMDHLNLGLMNLDLKMNDIKMNEAAMKYPFRNMAYNMNPMYPKGNNGNVNSFKMNVGVNKYPNNQNGKEANGKHNGGNNNNGGNSNNNSVDKRFKTLPTSEMLPRNEVLGGYIFVCNNDTMQEDLKRQLFGLPARYRDSVRAITPGLPLFLYNYTTHQLHGVFERRRHLLHHHSLFPPRSRSKLPSQPMDADDPRRGAARKSAPGQPWSHGETMHLIDVYEDRWTKLRRGQLKAHQWEDVAAEVTHRCGGQRKTGTQCRHKLEKLRKRYRTEAARPVASLWPFFRRMERLERGPVPTATNSFAASPPHSDDDDHLEDQEEDEEEEQEDQDEEEEEEEEEEQLLVARNSTRSINGLVRDAGGFRGGFAPRQQSPPAVTLSTAPPRKRVSYEFQSKAAAADRVKVEEAPVADRHSVAGVLRDIGEGIKRLERRRMEVQWEIERGWKETEARNNQMLQDAQRQLQDALPPPGKKARRDHGSSADDGL